MDDATSAAVGDYFCKHLEIGDTDEDRGTESLIRRALHALPQPEAWICQIHEELGTAAALLLADDRLIQVDAGRNGEGDGAVRLRSTSWPLVGSRVVVELEWGKRKTVEQRVYVETTWKFRLWEKVTVEVKGVVQTMPGERMDREEDFARRVAGKLGLAIPPASA